jgi:hypothetical protein
MQLHVKRLTPTARLPVRATENASCFDVHADMEGTIPPGERVLVKTGLSVAVPPGFEVQVRSRSGLALKQGSHLFSNRATALPRSGCTGWRCARRSKSKCWSRPPAAPAASDTPDAEVFCVM